MSTIDRSSTAPEFGAYRPPASPGQAPHAAPALDGETASKGVLAGVRIVSLALNLPGPVALMRLAQMGAICDKIEPPALDTATGDPLASFAPIAFDELHRGISRHVLDLKHEESRHTLDTLLGEADVLITSFRPSALQRLGVDRATLHARFPALAIVNIMGERGVNAEQPGHDLTYEAQAGLVSDLRLPAVPFADMAGALLVSDAVLRLLLARLRDPSALLFEEVALADAARFLALPREWGLTQSPSPIGGSHAGYRLYACRDGRVAVAALEPRFAAALCRAAGVSEAHAARLQSPAACGYFEAFFADRECAEVQRMALEYDLPMAVMPDRPPRA